MDKIDGLHIKMLQYGGNRKFLEFIRLYNITNNDKDRHSKYITKAVDLYRRLLSEMAIKDIKIPIESWIFNELKLEDGQDLIYDKQYAEIRASSLSKSRLYKRKSSITTEAKQFGQFLREQFWEVTNIPKNFCCGASTVRKSELNRIVN